MDQHIHHDRTVRLLETQLEALANVTEKSLSGRPIDRQVVALEAATLNAVELDLLSREEAGGIWNAVARRHPGVRWCQSGCPGLQAA